MQQFLKREKGSEREMFENERMGGTTMRAIQDDIVDSYKKVKEETENKGSLSTKIFNRISVEEITEALFQFILPELTEARGRNMEVTEEAIRHLDQCHPFEMLDDVDESIVSVKPR